LQKARTEKNKRLRIERAPKKSVGHVCPKKADVRMYIIISWRAKKERVYIG
jgi:hypothetical protein